MSKFFFQTGYFSKLGRFTSFLKLSADFFISIKGNFFNFFKFLDQIFCLKEPPPEKLILDYDLAIKNLQFGIGLTLGGFDRG